MSDNGVRCPECDADEPANVRHRGRVQVGDVTSGMAMGEVLFTAELYECGDCGAVFAVRRAGP